MKRNESKSRSLCRTIKNEVEFLMSSEVVFHLRKIYERALETPSVKASILLNSFNFLYSALCAIFHLTSRYNDAAATLALTTTAGITSFSLMFMML